MKMRVEVLPSESAQDMDICGYQVADLEDIELHWEDSDLNMDVVFRPSIDNSFFPLTFNDLAVGSRAEIPILIGEKQEK